MNTDIFDYIIVGAGAGGATLAYELSRRTNKTILVLESGGPDLDPMIHIPKGFFFLYGGKKHSFYYETKPVPQSGEPDIWQRGRVDGGSTSINGMQYDRAGGHYWNSVAQKADERWSWRHMLDTFRSIEDHELGESSARGAGGPLSVHVTRDPEPLNDAVVEAAQAWGLPWTEDLNSHDGERIGYIPNTTKNGRRHNTARAFLSLAKKKRTVTHVNHAHAAQVHFDGRRAIGAETIVKGQRRMFRARREIILCAGPLESPLLLERSGVGQPEVLRQLGVSQVAESPHVGEHAVEQRMFAYQWRIKEQMGYNQKLSTKFSQLVAGAAWLTTRGGIISTGGYDLAAFAKSAQHLEVPDLFLMFTPHMLDLAATSMAVAPEPGFSGAGYLVTPTTESSIHATSQDPFAPPVIDAHYLEDEAECEAQYRGLQIVREIVAQHPLADLVTEEQAPGPNVNSREEAIGHSWASGHALHACGTVRMGSADDAPLDADLRVRGVEGLRVADASVLPRQPGNTMAPSIGVGARAAALIADQE
ncbi:GMC family oxidoreductase N-terminal domain-containing protein [Enteractinococcus fodinae]|uniref:Choline dehydrogenase-like flavoprotein n=1 Tax=Enteractinococcus fodinae TaxID=684663 RepID=A0ABU2AXS2_9MICC|nr:GMC family oxidoreductase N-terminal domain-containing protein [Enteractinococcus fodinae]MDR7345841.1 choline dehydrogenase-like flavoprotein [Enteractinococcus fodinae]